MNSEIKVSVLCLTYNQEKYIKQCLEGLVTQKTGFKYEIIVHDDASTDATANIVKEYENRYPNLLKGIYQNKNQYSKGVKIVKDIMINLANGKYIAICEGDDYWSDEFKLQKQFDVLENNPDSCLCVHRVQAIEENGIIASTQYPNFDLSSGVYSSSEFMELLGKSSYGFQTSSYMRKRNDMLEYYYNTPKYVEISDVGDIVALLYFGSKGPVCYLNDIMSCYRLGASGSWSQVMAKDNEKKLNHIKNMIKVYDSFFECTNNKYNEYFERRRNNYYLKYCTLTCSKSKNARELLKKKNRYFYNTLTFKNRLYIIFCAFLPFFGKVYNKVKGIK